MAFPFGRAQQLDHVEFGPDLDHGSHARLISNVDASRVLELGCANGASAVALARKGAKVISVDPSADHLLAARRLAEDHGVRVEFHQGDLADLAFVRGETIHVCLAVYSLAQSDDLSRVFRQVHRVLRRDAPFVMSLPHPFFHLIEPGATRPEMTEPYPSPNSFSWEHAGHTRSSRLHSIADIVTQLTRCNFRVDAMVEPMPASQEGAHMHDSRGWGPETLIVRARKVGQ